MMIVDIKTKKFVVKGYVKHFEASSLPKCSHEHKWHVICDLNCNYSQQILLKAVAKRPECLISITNGEMDDCEDEKTKVLQFRDFENIEWEPVMAGQHIASSYLIRKGLSRKAQLYLQMKKYFRKHKSNYETSVPATIIIETWNAFEDLKVDFGNGLSAAFDSVKFASTPLRQRLEWALDDVSLEFHQEDRKGWTWILKPSVTNKGADVSLICSWDELLDALENTPFVREWVLQRYVEKPLLIGGHKFHLRVYVLCVGALRVLLFERILVLLAAHKYNDGRDLNDIYAHLTNTAVGAELEDFDESKVVKLLDDLPAILQMESPHLFPCQSSAEKAVESIRTQVREITNELFKAFENEYTVFAPLSNCFELFGLDFLVDEDFRVIFLEANPGPDFKQTGDRLKVVIESLFEQTCSIVMDHNILSSSSDDRNVSVAQSEYQYQRQYQDFSVVYDKEWSANKIKGGFNFS